MGLNTYDDLAISTNPELIFGLVGPIGVDMERVQNKLEIALRTVGYTPISIRITELMKQIPTSIDIKDDTGPLDYYESRIDYANKVREKCKNDAALAALSIAAIKNYRSEQHPSNHSAQELDNSLPSIDLPLKSTAYIIRQFKRKEEIALMRAVYDKKFVQISVHCDKEKRHEFICNEISRKNSEISSDEIQEIANKLIKRDLGENLVKHGQRLEKIFHLGDVFVNAKSDKKIGKTVRRFVEVFFGKNSTSPSIDEYGAYIAASASLRSLDPSRQVGAAIFSKKGEIIAMGSNEVPSPGGGTYWADHKNPHRDFDDRRSPNSVRKNRILYDLLNRLSKIDALKAETNESQKLKEIMKDPIIEASLLNDITEYGRMTHAEMNAITDAARLGRKTKDSTLYCTTFPCHNCAKHIVASGIDRVVFIEPYPKSLATKLNGDSINLEKKSKNKVVFQNFVGISPRRYRDIFEKGKRRDSRGEFKEWYEGVPAPRVLDRGAGYVLNESSAILSSLEHVKNEIFIEGETID